MYVSDNVRQKFTGKERDSESGLDYFLARDYSGPQGRFTSVDPLASSAHPAEPQSWNRYTYAANNPLKFTDPTGMSYFVGGSGAADPFIPEYRFDGFEQSPEGTMSNITTEDIRVLPADRRHNGAASDVRASG
jgi:RHS repeat-associated protein